MSNPPLFGLTGLADAGKSTLGSHLERTEGFVRLPMAGPLKNMLKAIGLSDAHVSGPLKYEPCALLCGQTPRFAMQTLGTEWGREMIGSSFWVSLWVSQASTWMASGVGVVCDDVRFNSEALAIRALGGAIVKIERSGLNVMDHVSENGIDSSLVDFTIENNGSQGDLFELFQSIRSAR